MCSSDLVVDWKTGQPPASDEERRVAAVQLAAYRLAWAGLAQVPIDQVRAAFYYVREDLTLRPADLLDEAGLAALIESIPPQPGPAPTAKHPGSGRGRRRRQGTRPQPG